MDKAMERLKRLREYLFCKIDAAFESGAGGKSTEGLFEIAYSFPDYYDERWDNVPPPSWKISLYCYVVGSHRHYEWTGKTFDTAVRKAEKAIYGWFYEKPPKEE